jgi:hypothetical protein
MSARVGAVAKRRQLWEPKDPLDNAETAMLEAADQIARAANDLKMLNEVLSRVDRNVTAAAKRVVKQKGRWPLRLNSRKAKGK